MSYIHELGNRFKVKDRVRVTSRLVDIRRDSNLCPHPHAGKTGIILNFDGLYIERPNGPTAHIKVDPEFREAGNIMIVSVKFLELVERNREI